MKVKLFHNCIFVPEIFLSQDGIDVAISAVAEWLASAPAELLDTPWIIGSFTTDITGTPRTSISHQKGLAVDFSPTYSDEALLNPAVMPGLAWNVADLAVISQTTYRRTFWCAEGDHIHMSLLESEPSIDVGQAWAFPSAADAYHYTSFLREGVASGLLGQPYLWDCKRASLLGPNEPFAQSKVGDVFFLAANASGDRVIPETQTDLESGIAQDIPMVPQGNN